ncbi:HYC_CC_PP family protein [Mucilaginibacter segetis]|uniref:Uncharacterized protein n=1 Tax=Mucilaginibacter segetis TaxID=2793071 RepID=A0A934UMU5_9SPHI|nr:hypothetical protein [Mucilaginibacter segetis]MBK0379236.1 hypothetical protein [Mucilaginibacter segetis]
MKRVFALLFTLIYVLSATGVSAAQFYCCGRLASTTFTLGEGDSRAHASLPLNGQQLKGKDCCQTTHQVFKLKDRHFGATETAFKVIGLAVAVPAQKFEFLNIAAAMAAAPTLYAHAPPQLSCPPVYLLNCNYRI